MERYAFFVAENGRLTWSVASLLIAALMLLTGHLESEARREERLTRLKTIVERSGNEIMFQTVDGSLMGAVALLGLTDSEVKADAQGRVPTNNPRILATLEAVAQAHRAEGVFVVGQDGIIRSSWNGDGKPSTGLNIKFRPYFQMAQQGTENIYAAVSLARSDRVLYFSAPIFAATSTFSNRAGAIVARTSSANIDELLRRHADIAILVSPQGVVFASNRTEWIGHLTDTPTPERLREIRELKQFGALFETRTPPTLALTSHDGFQILHGTPYAVAVTRVPWNDPAGDWKLVLLEDLSQSVPLSDLTHAALKTGAAAFLVLLLLHYLLHSIYRQAHTSQELRQVAEAQSAAAALKNKLAGASMRMLQADTAHELAQIFLSEAHRIFGTLQGAVYARQRQLDGSLECIAAYACYGDLPQSISPDDGLLGQCVRDARRRIIDAPDITFMRIRSGLGETLPATVIIDPLLLNDTLIGVSELASVKALDDAQLSSLSELVQVLAMKLEILRKNSLTEAQLEATTRTIRELEQAKANERIKRLSLSHEQRVKQLKQQINEMAVAAGKEAPYPSTLIEMTGDHQFQTPADASGNDSTTPEKPLELGDLTDLAELQTQFSDYCETIGVAAAIIDLKGKILAASRWQPACTEFHRTHPESCARCIESDTELAMRLREGRDFSLYRCKNGMTDCASPIIIEGRHLANVFVGQFHLGPPDLDFFAEQARRYSFPRDDYLRAIRAAPVMEESRIPAILGFLTNLARLVGTKTYVEHGDGGESDTHGPESSTGPASESDQSGALREQRA